jgi:type IV secretory pathway VirJ component
MKRIVLWFLCLLIVACKQVPHAEVLAHGRFSSIDVYHEDGHAGPPILLIADSATDAAVSRKLLARMLALNTDVFVISTDTLQKDFAADLAQCNDFNGDFGNLARYVEAYLQLPGFTPPILATTTSSNALAETLLTPVSPQVFPGRLLLAANTSTPAADDVASYPDCGGASATTAGNTVFEISVNAGDPDAEQLEAAFYQLNMMLPEQQSLDENVAGLPLTELPADETTDSFAILLSGDGGWAGFDQDLAAALQKQGIAVVGWDSLRYFWQPRTPESLAADLDRVIEHYQQTWHKQHVILIGFSQGGNVLPFTLEHLAKSSASFVSAIVLISPEEFAQFEFHLSNWIHATEGLPLLPVLSAYSGMPLYCVYGTHDEATVCPMLEGTQVQVKGFDAGHHLYDAIPAIVALVKN